MKTSANNCNTSHKGEELEATQMSISKRVKEEKMTDNVVDGKLGHKFFPSLHLHPSNMMPSIALMSVDVRSSAL